MVDIKKFYSIWKDRGLINVLLLSSNKLILSLFYLTFKAFRMASFHKCHPKSEKCRPILLSHLVANFLGGQHCTKILMTQNTDHPPPSLAGHEHARFCHRKVPYIDCIKRLQVIKPFSVSANNVLIFLPCQAPHFPCCLTSEAY